MNRWLGIGKKVKKELKDDRATGLAAEQAYYYMLALFPILILLLSIVPYLNIDPQKAIGFINSYLPSETASLMEETVVDIVSERNGGLLTFGILGTIWSASNGMNAFIRAMNFAFDVDETRSFIKTRLLSIGLTLGMIVAFLVALVLPVFGDVIIDLIKKLLFLPDSMEILFRVLRWAISISVMVVVLALLYRLAPNKHFPFKHVLPGALTATLVWQLISLGFSFYVSHFGNYASTYGSLGGVIILMLWLYFTGLALVLGGEVNAVYHREKMTAENEKRSSKRSSALTT
ncbi:YihY/virulence factor BrkB family protein [Peribacillus saganii]|uniref:YihY/virulence factor BrkB family protein n=1 Tax=Peribacillus saganii TaxID=2303992 RepID=A0A372LPZ5_9BACI|nr:YihY/virulence factor BrkB family protein [Peribacillus saganii]RFU70179.1 YihY/virulence factor BrkB family protein [Peribacillus saganii]